MSAGRASVPQLRFPGFEGAWAQVNLGKIAKFSKGKGVSKSDIVTGGRTPCIRYGELYTTYGTKIDKVESATNVPVQELALSQGNEVIVPSSGEDAADIATAAAVLRPGVALGGDLNILRGNFVASYIAEYLAGKKRLEVAALAQGNSVVHLYASQLSTLEVALPSLPEQQKIAAFLDTVSRKVALLEEKTAALTEYKRGLMQRLFSGELRFTRDDGSAFPDWEERSLGGLATIRKGEQINRNSLGDGGEYPVTNGGTGPSGYYHASNAPAQTITISEGGNSCGYVAWQPGPFWCGGHCYVIEPKISTLLKTYLFHALKNAEMHIMRLRVGSGLPNIQKGDLSRVEIMLPHPDEQRKIAGVLSALDAKIDALSRKISETAAFRKGLLQQLFV